jgi:hypothetical protein
MNSLVDQRPRSGWSKPRIVETSDIFYFIQYPKKNTYRSENDKILGYGYVLDGIVTAVGEVGISGSTVYLTLLSPARHSIRGGQRLQPIFTGIGVKYFNFNFSFVSVPPDCPRGYGGP